MFAPAIRLFFGRYSGSIRLPLRMFQIRQLVRRLALQRTAIDRTIASLEDLAELKHAQRICRRSCRATSERANPVRQRARRSADVVHLTGRNRRKSKMPTIHQLGFVNAAASGRSYLPAAVPIMDHVRSYRSCGYLGHL